MNFKMIRKKTIQAGMAVAVLLVLVTLWVVPAYAEIPGLTGTTFNFTAKAGFISFADGGTATIWGIATPASPAGFAQFPGPTLIVDVGDTVTINLSNELPEPVSLIFPGLSGPTDPVFETPGDRSTLRSLAPETPAGLPGAPSGPVAYTFMATKPGTYYYQSGTNMAKQVYMGLFGAIIVRPSGYTEFPLAAGNEEWTRLSPAIPGSTAAEEAQLTRHAYGVGDPDDPGDATSVATRYHREYLCLLHEIDPAINQMVAAGGEPDFTDFKPAYWTVNGRALPDDLKPHGFPLLPSQPYGAFYMMHPGERTLVRIINMGRDPHPWHTHTNHLEIIAHDGNVLQTAPSQGTDLSRGEFTLSPFPGQTFDAIFEWTGEGLGWDIYGHATADSGAPCNPLNAGELAPFEDPDDHCKAFPSTMPDPNNSTFGGFWSGSPFMGQFGSLPPGEGGLNPWGGYVAIWHSHAEKELQNFDVFPGGMLTFMAEIPIWDPDGVRNAIPY